VLAGCPVYEDCTDDGTDGDPADVVRQELTVRRHQATPVLDNGDADCILADATKALQTGEGTDDVACAVRLARRGSVTEFNHGDGSIDSQAEFDALMRLPGGVKLVDEIIWCRRLMPNIAGCARSGSSLAVIPIASNMAGVPWAHEYGHVKGRHHRNVDNALMHERPSTDGRRVNQAECDAFRC